MTLKEAQKEVDSWIKQYGVRYFSELTNMAVLTEEVGELARVMARKYGDQSFKEGEKDNIEEEIADVLWVLLCIANQTGVDVTEAFARSIEKKPNVTKQGISITLNYLIMENNESTQNKYDAALAKYNTNLNDAEVAAEVAKIIEEKVPANNTPEVKKFLFNCIDLTTLNSTDSDESVMKFTQKVNRFDEEFPDLKNVAAICVYPNFAEVVKDTLEVEDVKSPVYQQVSLLPKLL